MVDRTPPIRTYCANSATPPRAPIEGRAKGRPRGCSTNRDGSALPCSTNRGVPAPLSTLLPSPSPQDVKLTRLAAGHTQAQAAAAIGASRWQTWSDYEGGINPMPPLAWTWYLLVTCAHPVAALKRRTKKRSA